jgi:hypothetical protein
MVQSFGLAIVYLVIIAALAWLAMWVVQQFPPPEPVNRVVRVAIVILAVIAALLVFADAFGVALFRR